MEIYSELMKLSESYSESPWLVLGRIAFFFDESMGKLYGKWMVMYGRLMTYDIWEIYGHISCVWLVVTGT